MKSSKQVQTLNEVFEIREAKEMLKRQATNGMAIIMIFLPCPGKLRGLTDTTQKDTPKVEKPTITGRHREVTGKVQIPEQP